MNNAKFIAARRTRQHTAALSAAQVLYAQLLDRVDKNKLVARYATESSYKTANAEKVFERYIKFIVLKMMERDFKATKLSPGQVVDEMWHLHILDTVDYAKMCGETMIHHEPVPTSQEAVDQRYANTLKAFKKYFGEQQSSVVAAEPSPEDVIPVTVKTLFKKEMLVLVNKTDTVRVIMDIIAEKWGYPAAEQKLVCGGRSLMSYELIHNTSIEHIKHVFVVGPHIRPDDENHTLASTELPPTMQIFYTTLMKSNYGTLQVNPLDKILKVKILISRKSGIPEEQLRLFYASKQLEDHKTLADYNIQREATITLILNIRGC